jgi:membrane dipeptidase
MNPKYYFSLFLFLTLSSLAYSQTKPDAFYKEKAIKLAHKYILADGHVDLPYRLKIKKFRLEKEFVGIPLESKEGDFDFKRAKEGGLDAPFMSIYIPSSYDTAGAQILADSLINMVNYIASENPNYFGVVKSPKEIKANFKKGIVSLPMGMENGSPIASLEDVQKYKNKGISYITLTHAKDNKICDSSYDTTHTWDGLSAFGEKVVLEMAKTGILIDISHVSDATFYDVLKIAPVPIIASHSSVRYFTPGFQRNMADEMITELGKKGGVIMVNFGSTFLDGKVAKLRNESQKEIKQLLDSKGIDPKSAEAEKIADEYYAKNPKAFSDVNMVANHIDRIVQLAGIDHVGIGSDFDGVGDSLPTGLKDVADYPNLIAELLKRGYKDKDIEKICSGNIFKVWNQVLDFAQKNSLSKN